MKLYKIILFCIICIFNISSAYTSPLVFEEDKVSIPIPIIMYHNLSRNIDSQGKWVISTDEMEEDFIYLSQNNYNPIFLEDLTNFVKYGIELPENPIILTYDDGDSSMIRYLLPLISKYDMKVVISIIGSVTDEYTENQTEHTLYYPHITWNQVNDLIDTGLVEIQNHSYDMHKDKGAVPKKNESVEDFRSRATNDIMKMQDRITEMTGAKSTYFTYPFGSVSAESKKLIRDLEFDGSLGCVEYVSLVTTDNYNDLFDLGRILRPHGEGTNEFFDRVEIKRQEALTRESKRLAEENKDVKSIFEQ